MMGRRIIGEVALCSEAAACLAWALDAPDAGWVAHVLASLLAASRSMNDLPAGDRGRAGVAALLLVLALPVVGALLLRVVLWPSWSRAGRRAPRATLEIALPDGGEERGHPGSSASARSVRELLSDEALGADRLDALLCLRRMDPRRAVPLLRLAFTHPSEDVRLLAFAILDGRERRLRAAVRSEEERLEAMSGRGELASAEAACQRRLAHHYWEIVYAGFASGDLEPELLERSARHAASALRLRSDVDLWLLLARIRLRQRRPSEAWTCLEHAERAGASLASSVPLFAEAAYALRRFKDIPRLLSRARPGELRRPELLSVAQFWMDPGRS